MTTLASKAMNAFPTLVLRSPFHRLLSSRYLLLSFTGHKSGRSYTTPVAYIGDRHRLLISTDSPWARNVVGGRAVTVRLRGSVYTGSGHRVSDPAASEAAIRSLLAIPGYARAAGIMRTSGSVTEEEIRRAAREGTIITIELGSRS